MSPFQQYSGSESMPNQTHNQIHPEPASNQNNHVWVGHDASPSFTFEDVMSNSFMDSVPRINYTSSVAPSVAALPAALGDVPASSQDLGRDSETNYSYAVHNNADSQAFEPPRFNGFDGPSPPTSTLPLSAPGSHTCPICPAKAFAHRKDLRRHIGSVHATGKEPIYCCRCGKLGVRKDNHLRHVRSCNKWHFYPYYFCKCLLPDNEKELHIDHVKNCRYGFSQNGRPSAGSII